MRVRTDAAASAGGDAGVGAGMGVHGCACGAVSVCLQWGGRSLQCGVSERGWRSLNSCFGTYAGGGSVGVDMDALLGKRMLWF